MSNKIIWITGGSSGIGFATAKHFLKRNWVVIISSSNIEKLTNAKNRIINKPSQARRVFLLHKWLQPKSLLIHRYHCFNLRFIKDILGGVLFGESVDT